MDVVHPLKEILPRSPTPLSIYRYFFFMSVETRKVAWLNDSDSRYFPAPPRWVRDGANRVELPGSSIIMAKVVGIAVAVIVVLAGIVTRLLDRSSLASQTVTLGDNFAQLP